jgi:cytochrome P450
MTVTPDFDVAALDPFTDEFQQCPFPALAALRAGSPVQPLVEPGWYIVTTMELVRELLSDPKRFSNQVSRRTPPPPEVADEVAEIRAQGFPYVPTLLLNDPPEHTRYRQLVQRTFTPRALSWMQPLVAEVAEELAARLPDGGPMDLIEVFTRPLPVWAISRVLGLADERRDDVRRWTDAATATIGAQLPARRWPAVERDLLDFQHSIAAELEQRRRSPSDDLLTALVQSTTMDADSGAAPIGTAELVSLTRELMVAGNESSLRLLADIIWQLDARPEEWACVRAEPRRAERLVEEAVRLASPSAAVFRRVVQDTTLGGFSLPAGATLVVSVLSANRDETEFPDPDIFDPDRPLTQRHVSFGQGIHSCIGNVLARMEARHAVQALAKHVERIDVVDRDSLRHLPSLIVRGLAELPSYVHRRSSESARGE